MARKLRIQYEGAVYHVMNRGDRREPIFKDDHDRKTFLETLGQCCSRTLLARSVKPPPLAEGLLNQLAKDLFPPGLCDPSFVIPLDDPEIAVAILEFVQSKQIPKSALAVRASINTQRDHDGADLPPHVIELVRKTGCKVGFSFIYTPPHLVG